MLCVLAVPPPHIYIGGRGRGAARGTPSRRNPTWVPPPIRPPPIHKFRRGKERGGRRKVRGAEPPLPSPIRPPSIGGGAPLVGWCAPLLWPIMPIIPPGGSGNPPGTPICTRYTPEHFWCPNTIILHMNLLPLDHFETPRHVCDLIRDSEQHSVTKSHNS